MEHITATDTTRKSKMLLIFPFLALPFLCLLFWSLGGGRSSQNSRENVHTGGLNTNLPEAQLDDSQPLDKLSLYQKAEKDSMKKAGEDIDFPMSLKDKHGLEGTEPSVYEYPFNPKATVPGHERPYSSRNYRRDANEAKIRSKLAELEKALSNQVQDTLQKLDQQIPEKYSSDIDRLEEMMQANLASDQHTDPELNRINDVLDKILDIQHPDRIQERLRTASEKEKGKVFPVQTTRGDNYFDDLLKPVPATHFVDTLRKPHSDTLESLPVSIQPINQFFDLEETEVSRLGNAISAVVHETQTIVEVGSIKLRLMQDIYIHGQLVPAGTSLFAEGRIEGERVKCVINKIQYRGSLFSVSLNVYDEKDGIAGIHIRGLISADAAKKGSTDLVQNLELATLDPSVAAQAASTGIEAVKNFFNRKAKPTKATLKAGHPVLLLDANSGK